MPYAAKLSLPRNWHLVGSVMHLVPEHAIGTQHTPDYASTAADVSLESGPDLPS